MTEQITLQNAIVRGLACVAIHPELRSVLLVDATPAQVDWCADLLTEMMAVVEVGTSTPPITLATTEDEDLLWGVPFLPDQQGATRFVQRGLLSKRYNETQPRLIVVPNLAQVSLAAQRAAIMSVAADVVHLERHGQQSHWQRRDYWLAACARDELGKVSPHLLDRFLLRMTVIPQPALDAPERVAYLQQQVAAQKESDEQTHGLPPDLVITLKQATGNNPVHSPATIQRVLEYVSPTATYYSLRRDIALAQVAVAHAMLAGHARVQPIDVDVAAQVMSYSAGASVDSVDKPRNENSRRKPPAQGTQAGQPRLSPGSDRQKSGADNAIVVNQPDKEQALPAVPLSSPAAEPYVEDELPPEREAASLRLPFRQSAHQKAQRGPITGVMPATSLQDLALVRTLFEALKFHHVRQRTALAQPNRLLLHRSDLRSYRRSPFPETLLVLVIDYTALRHCDWETALLPHLEWAYTARSPIALIRVGAAGATNECRAECIVGRNLLDSRITTALEAEPGLATPLAHGLELALQTLQRALQHGRSAALQARLVVLTDGRGNVPLTASYSGGVTRPVNREGIDDALRVAAALGRLNHVEIVCLDPQLSHYAELAQLFADHLGVIAQPVPKADWGRADNTNLRQEANPQSQDGTSLMVGDVPAGVGYGE